MKDNSRFVIAIHTLTLLAEKAESLPSSFIALSAGVNAVTVRKVVGQLRHHGFVVTMTGSNGGTSLAKPPSDINLRDVYMAVRDDSPFGAYPDSPSTECTVGRNLKGALENLLDEAVQNMITTLGTITIADVLQAVETQHQPE